MIAMICAEHEVTEGFLPTFAHPMSNHRYDIVNVNPNIKSTIPYPTPKFIFMLSTDWTFVLLTNNPAGLFLNQSHGRGHREEIHVMNS